MGTEMASRVRAFNNCTDLWPCQTISTRRITWREVKVEKAAEDGTLADPDGGAEGTWTLSRRELEERGSTIHGTLRTRFYVDQEVAEAAG